MLQWASSKVHSLELVAQIFALLYRQYDEIHEVAQALRKTYVIEVEENGEGKPNYDISSFRQALGYLRLHLKVGMGKAEEMLLKESLRSIRNSDLFYCHPHLLRSLGVHSTVLGLMKTYLGISSGSVDNRVLTARRKQRLAMLKEGLPAPVEACCKFLCKFARVSHANQMALFQHIGYLLEHSKKYPGLMTCKGYTPLDVATATIKDNQELVLALEPSHLEDVVSLLVATTTDPHNETLGHENALTTVRTASVSCEWAPNGGEKCLEFLQSAVWVDNEQIQENAYLVVRLLIRRSECLGPALAGEALGLRWIYEEAIDHLEDTPQFFTPRDSTMDLLQSQDSTATSELPHSHSSYNLTVLNTRLLLSFYTNVVRLLAFCGPGSNSSQCCSTAKTLPVSKQKRSKVERTRSILQNLIKVDEIVGILSLPFSKDTQNGLCPQHKEAALLFLDRAYGVTGHELLLRLLTDAFLPDIKSCLKLVQDGNESERYSSLSRYICCSILPLLSRFASVFRQLLSHLHVIDNLLMCCFRLAYTAQLSGPQLEEIATFLMTIIRELHPRVIQRFMPKIVADIPNLNTHSHSIVTLKLLSSHYEYFARYYGSGMLDRTCLGLASEEEKTCSALVVYRLLDTLSEKLPSNPSLLRSSTSCLRAVSSALGPDCLVPSRLLMASMYKSSTSTYEPRPVDTSHVVLSPELTDFVRSFASFQHDCWTHEKQSVGWTYGPQESEKNQRHPYLRPFNTLPEQYCRLLTQPAEEAVKYLLVRGWSLSKVKPMDTQSVPLKKKMTCIRRRRRRAGSFIREEEKQAADYEPSVMDLSKVETPVELLSIAEQMAENAHDKWAKELDLDNADFLSHQLYQPYELLDEVIKDKDRTYALDILRYLRVSGFELNRTRVRMSTLVQSSQGSQCQEKFAIQLFGKALELLEAKLEMGFYLRVLFPMLTSYLNCHAGYFMPMANQRSNSFASQEEKSKILKMFCHVMEFTRHNLDKLFASAKKLTAQTVLSPVDGKGKEGEGEASVVAARGILALVESLVRALDMKGVLEGSVVQEHTDIVDFFRQATSGIHLTTKGISRQTEADVQFHFYCLHFLIPSLTTLFRHLGITNAGCYVIAGPVINHCRYIFQNLVDMAMGSGPVFVGSSPLIAIGKCMGAFSLAYPEPFLDHGLFGKGFNMELLLRQLGTATMQGVTGGNVLFVVDVIIPVLASYIARWWRDTNDGDPAPVSVVQVDEVLTQVLSLMAAHFGQHRVKWFIRLIESSLLLAGKCSLDLLESQFVPLLEELRERAISIWQDEHYLYATKSSEGSDTQTQKVEALNEDYCIFVRDLVMVLPFLSVFLHTNCEALRNPEEGVQKAVQNLFVSVTDIFHCWFSSQHFRRELQSAMQNVTQNAKILILNQVVCSCSLNCGKGAEGKRSPNLLLVCLQLLLPVNDQWLSKGDRELVDWCRGRLGEKGVTPDDLKVELMEHLESQLVSVRPLARKLVHHLSKPFFNPVQTLAERALQILSLARVKHRMYQVENPVTTQSRWRQLFTQRKRKAVIDCFLAVPFYQLSKHRAVNLFLQTYCSRWLMNAEYTNHEMLTEELLDHQDHLHLLEQERGQGGEGEESKYRRAWVPRHDPLSQLFTMFRRLAGTESRIDEVLYTSYADVLSKSVIGHSEDDEMAVDDNPTKAYELYSKRKAELIVKQAQLAERGAHMMMLFVITASKGEMSPVVHSTLRLGIALLKEGNQKIQHDMLEQLKGMDVGFLLSISKLISSCSVLDWNAYERYNKSEPVQTTSNTACCKVLPESTFTTTLFRFLQLLCEGHNEVFQNYLRTQAGNTTTVNIIICTVDYLLRLQESISDFYWHYSDYDTIDLQGRENFLKAFKVAKQVFRTLTEYIQGPCVKNQEALAHSRLWDAVSGFLQVFAVLQRKLYRDTSQMELLRELLGLQEEMFILLLSMLEGSVMSSNIGKLMVDMLMESAQYIEDIIQFFSMFVKLNDVTTSKAFKEYDQNKDGLISYREFEKAMEDQQRYTKEEIVYLMECADTNKDGLLDYKEFTERFHQPAESIGFHLCVLIVHLLDHLPQDRRLECFKYSPQGMELMGHFERNMGCIEILGKSRGIERVYFEVKASQLRQWKDVTIQESKLVFLHSVELGSQKKKLQGFISFCEDTIFEMDYMDTISGAEHMEREARAMHHRGQHTRVLQLSPQPFLSRIRARVQAFRDEHSPGQRLLAWLSAVMTLTVMRPLTVCSSITRTVRERALVGFTALKQKFRPKVMQKSVIEKRKRSKLHLDIHPPVLEVTKAATAREEKSEFFRPRAASSTLDVMKGREEKSRPRSSSNIMTASSDTDTDSCKCSLVHVPRQFHMRQLTLSYNRSRMKPPSQCLETPSPSPQPSQQSTAATGEESYMPKIAISTRNWQSFLARNYYRLNNLKFAITFIINILLLTVQVEKFSETVQPRAENVTEQFGLQEMFWSPLLLRGFSTCHFLLSVVLIAAYWHLKVPLIIFKREKQVARHLEMHHMWVRKRPETFRDWWDHWVISARSFPQKYWDKQVKQRVCDQFGCDGRARVEQLLGMEVSSKYKKRTKWDLLLETMHSLVDLRYWVWFLGVVLSNMMVLYHILYCGLSFVGLHLNYFYFSVHLLDLVMNFKLLKHVLASVLHNYKQLGMTLLLTCVVIYMYTVIAFNFFRKFYREPGQEVYHCESMARCFIYHIDQGLRSGGGIADKLEPASGDPSEFLRLFFDITFFFFVIVILLAIMQGLIIDAFGELRDKEETLTAVMQTKCFICGLDKASFEHIPHGFDNHIHNEHNMAHYMFMLLYLIKKEESEFSGQESYVWDMYLKQNWDFFPVGDCFHAQEDRREQQRKAKQAPSPARAAKPVTQL